MLLPALNEHQVAPLNRSELDVARLDQVRKALAHYHPDLVINASAFNQVDGAESRVTEAFAINAVGPRNLAVATAANEFRFCTSLQITCSTVPGPPLS